MTEPTSTPTAAPKRRPALSRLMLGVAFAATFAAGGLVLSGPSAVAMQAAMEHAGGGHGGMHARMHAHMERMLTVAEATPEQRAKIHAIFKSAMSQMKPLHKEMAGAHRDLHRLLTAPTIDRAALEQLRGERMADADQASRILVKALADAAEVLTPEQRAKIGAEMAAHHGGHDADAQPQG
jgi:Spy/CpxP family protein refolding chaperone